GCRAGAIRNGREAILEHLDHRDFIDNIRVVGKDRFPCTATNILVIQLRLVDNSSGCIGVDHERDESSATLTFSKRFVDGECHHAAGYIAASGQRWHDAAAYKSGLGWNRIGDHNIEN